ncbi:hypothetical protein BCR39DRAFT_551909 [Naematelia encephala]|uniref:Uncharacterized protein n=1 Tax=Naematelia encephala TaxID=71784 RepID=A0A1Y2AID6_9TREE|nr:hypothetical protein BCR39DRAFT_551909 [Naematelia encephala]
MRYAGEKEKFEPNAGFDIVTLEDGTYAQEYQGNHELFSCYRCARAKGQQARCVFRPLKTYPKPHRPTREGILYLRPACLRCSAMKTGCYHDFSNPMKAEAILQTFDDDNLHDSYVPWDVTTGRADSPAPPIIPTSTGDIRREPPTATSANEPSRKKTRSESVSSAHGSLVAPIPIRQAAPTSTSVRISVPPSPRPHKQLHGSISTLQSILSSSEAYLTELTTKIEISIEEIKRQDMSSVVRIAMSRCEQVEAILGVGRRNESNVENWSASDFADWANRTIALIERLRERADEADGLKRSLVEAQKECTRLEERNIKLQEWGDAGLKLLSNRP